MITFFAIFCPPWPSPPEMNKAAPKIRNGLSYRNGLFFYEGNPINHLCRFALPTRILCKSRIEGNLLRRYGVEIHFVIPGPCCDAWIDLDIIICIDGYPCNVIGMGCAIGWHQFNAQDGLGVIDEGSCMPPVEIVEAQAIGGQLDPSFPSYFIQEDRQGREVGVGVFYQAGNDHVRHADTVTEQVDGLVEYGLVTLSQFGFCFGF